MVDLSTEYMGLKLRNPLVVGSSSLVKSAKDIKKWQDAGVGAVVMKSLFEEQIRMEAGDVFDKAGGDRHTEGYDYIMNTKMEFGSNEYLKIVEEGKKIAHIPVIASVNCSTPKGWTGYAISLQDAGADALELNISVMPTNPLITSEDVEERVLSIVSKVVSKISIPVAVKIGPNFSAPAKLVRDIVWRGAKALVLFNRFYQFDIDTDHMRIKPGHSLSSSVEICQALRWIAILSGRLNTSLAASTGIHTSKDVLKALLAGADVAQLCSTLYMNGVSVIPQILDGITAFMKENEFNTLSAFRGILSQQYSEQPESYERLQYIKTLVGIE
ncbi:MAG: dihydroorotate dehydrogenase-like protein [bacterium]